MAILKQLELVDMEEEEEEEGKSIVEGVGSIVVEEGSKAGEIG